MLNLNKLDKKYQHYSIIICVLLFVTYILEPMWGFSIEQQNKLVLLKKKAAKYNVLIEGADTLEELNTQATFDEKKALAYMFKERDSSKLKLLVQTQIEKILQESQCEMNRIGWKSDEPVVDDIFKWELEVLFNGSPTCLLSFNRKIENVIPLYNVEEFKYRGRDWVGNPSEKLSGEVTLSILQYIKEVQ